MEVRVAHRLVRIGKCLPTRLHPRNEGFYRVAFVSVQNLARSTHGLTTYGRKRLAARAEQDHETTGRDLLQGDGVVTHAHHLGADHACEQFSHFALLSHQNQYGITRHLFSFRHRKKNVRKESADEGIFVSL